MYVTTVTQTMKYFQRMITSETTSLLHDAIVDSCSLHDINKISCMPNVYFILNHLNIDKHVYGSSHLPFIVQDNFPLNLKSS